MRRLVLLLLSFGIGVLGCQADCRACASDSNVACISETQFQFCVDNQLTGPENSCPLGSFCTSQTFICQSNETLKACGSGCNRCDDQRVFACTGIRTFALCLGSNTHSNSISTCPTGNVCNINLPSICGDATTTQATCNEATTTNAPSTPTQRPPNEIDEFCRTVSNCIPVHAIPNDTLCNSYVHCSYNNSSWIGSIITCPAAEPYFNGNTLSCGTTKPTQPSCL